MKRKFLVWISLMLVLLLSIPALTGCAADPEKAVGADVPRSVEDLAGKRIGIITGSAFDRIIRDKLPPCRTEYYNSYADLALALENGKIDAYVTDEPIARKMIAKYPNQGILKILADDSYGFIFEKDSEKGALLCRQMNDFLAKLTESGTLRQIADLWLGGDTAQQTVVTDDLTGENGTLRLALSTDTGEPFVYLKGGSFAGYDVDLAVRFCREYGYGIEFSNSNFNGILTAVSAGKSDFGASSISITAERAESVLFSDPNYVGGAALVTKNEAGGQTIQDLEYRNIGVLTGSVFDRIVRANISKCNVKYYNSNTDLAAALNAGKISAFAVDQPVARLIVARYPTQEIFAQLDEASYAFVFPKDPDRFPLLSQQFNVFLERLKMNGQLDEIDDIWFGSDTSRQTVDYENLPSENGVLNFSITTDMGAPFAYVHDGQYVGMDLDIAVRFCREYGYGIRIHDAAPTGMLAAVSGGKCDFGASGVTMTEERKESMTFSEPYYTGGCVLITDAAQGTILQPTYTSAEQLAGKKIGTVTGSIYDEYILQNHPDSEVAYFNTSADLGLALENERIAAYALSEPLARLLMNEYGNQVIISKFQEETYGFIFPKNVEKSVLLRQQFNDFLAGIRDDGTLDEIESIWFGSDDTLKVIHPEELTGENGTLNLAISTDVGAPFVYRGSDGFIGYDLDIAVRFCREYGYGLKFFDSNLTGMLALISGNKCDFGASCITITEERKESMLFSDPDYYGGGLLVVKAKTSALVPAYASVDELAGRKIAVPADFAIEEPARQQVPDGILLRYNSADEMTAALTGGEVDAFIAAEPTAQTSIRTNPDLTVLQRFGECSYAFAFPKNDDSQALCRQMNEFLAEIRADGTLNEITRTWLGESPPKNVPCDDLTGENGALCLVVSTDVGAPFCYQSDDGFSGLNVDLAVRFCRKYGYGLKIADCGFSEMLSVIADDRCESVFSCVAVTEERGESMLFSEPYYTCGNMIVVRAVGEVPEDSAFLAFLTSVGESFEKTFLRESRWKLFLSGILVTLIIALLSSLFGTLLGFLLYLLYRRKLRLPNAVINGFMHLMEKTPVVVILMILYYLVFGSITLDGAWVSVIGFSLIFASSVIGLLKVNVDTVDRGQREAALALGYTERQTFFKIVLPQAAKSFLPEYRSEIITLLKGTAIVGYIAVQDLTKIGDIIRSRTYEAFFPLIATAIIYFLIAWLLTWLIRRLERRSGNGHRKQSRLLKGVKTK